MFQVLILIAALATGHSIQKSDQVCSMTIAQAPSFRKLRLGMNLDEVYKVLPELRADEGFQNNLKQAADSRLPQSAGVFVNSTMTTYGGSEIVRGLKGIGLTFYENQLCDLSFEYDRPEWDSVDEFIERLRPVINLPDSFQAEGDRNRKTWKCNEVGIYITISSRGGSVRFSDMNLSKRMEIKRRQILKMEKDEFRP